VSPDIEKNLEVIDENKYRVVWKTQFLTKTLLFDNNKCTGCGMCAKACPLEAISIGPVQEIIEGKIEAPKILVDADKCVVCPVCSSVCMFGALTYTVSAEFYPGAPRIRGSIRIDENECVPCRICEKVCPLDAIKIELEVPKKEDLVIYEKEEAWGKGEIIIDKEKCVYCGLCEELCQAIKIIWVEKNEVKAPSYRYAVDILVDEEKCDYCGLCEDICPYDAIQVKCEEHAPRKVLKPIVKGKVIVEDEKCVYCGLCADKCPKNAITVEKPVLGELIVLDVEKCDPSGCKNCQLACPVRAFYVPKDKSEGKIRAVEDYCVYCGACANACPVDAIIVKRFDVETTPSSAPWSIAVNEHVNKVLEGFLEEKREARITSIHKKEVAVEERIEVWSEPPAARALREKLEKTLEKLRDPAEYKKLLFKALKG